MLRIPGLATDPVLSPVQTGVAVMAISEGQATCELCGEPMPPGEQMFNYHGYSGPCPRPPMPRDSSPTLQEQTARLAASLEREALLMIERDRFKRLVVGCHRRFCTAENCDLDGGPEHAEAFAG